MCDETVDISTTNELVLYCRCINGDGKFQANFLKVVALKDGKADTVKAALSHYMEENDLSIQKVAGFGSDGAACMIGNRSGVATQLKEDNAKIVSIHCIAHRLALAVGQGEIHWQRLQAEPHEPVPLLQWQCSSIRRPERDTEHPPGHGVEVEPSKGREVAVP
ncbi:E3 SUMO-protein ligase KIAA1586-like [Neoarius graeffei]|uniref:E3 SUMO-protein ligase KIAA1586-like n=1 Tax=Neoarius graeffei TaxID=443677 RepID=UPI00298D5FF2|nr:E3 SUMO-protein ligase KIAA1586-like [Neoarius graeffei]XP_060761280.1 E3 SUMO-protein ligase KIAA1586-like [Neoarius graeffei]